MNSFRLLTIVAIQFALSRAFSENLNKMDDKPLRLLKEYEEGPSEYETCINKADLGLTTYEQCNEEQNERDAVGAISAISFMVTLCCCIGCCVGLCCFRL